MASVLNFTLSEEGVAVFHDALACIVKFSEDVTLEARKDKLTLTALNLTKSAYVCFTFAANRFFSRYNFEGNAQYRDKFFCQLYIRSLMSVFRARSSGDPTRDRDRETTIDRCDVLVDDGPGRSSRLIAKIVCRNGITASHALPFEPKAPTHAKFISNEAVHHWAMSSRTLRQLMDHFGPGIELLDINPDDEARVVNFTCFTEKAVKISTKEEAVLKKPLHTSIAVDMEEFSEIEVENKLHIIISVKDFRAILQHAQSTSGALAARYSNPGRPMKLQYEADGIVCEFILMTVGEKDATAPQKMKNAKKAAMPARPVLEASSHRGSSVAAIETQQPSKEAPRPSAQHRTPIRARQAQFEIRPPPVPPPGTARSEGLFVTQDDDDHQWDPANSGDEEDDGDNARLEWDASAQPFESTMRINSHLNTQVESRGEAPGNLPTELEPTQRLSDVRRFGLFSPG
ncbi:hypothetical protein GQ53DRAFT_779740 [Thozetella sp. PMI_491]|nr:hypothetical protein GQ53DRAFT_779740 [Thozetella sp. PMI_491]